jgi:hypothetical protein
MEGNTLRTTRVTPFGACTYRFSSLADGIFKAALAEPLWDGIEADMTAFSLVDPVRMVLRA